MVQRGEGFVAGYAVFLVGCFASWVLYGCLQLWAVIRGGLLQKY